MLRSYFKGIGLLVGLIIGAGTFVLPFVIAKAGLFWGALFFLIASLLVFLHHFLYAEIVCYVKGSHQITGYARILLGRTAELLALAFSAVSFYGSLLAYGLLGGIFLSNIFSPGGGFSFSVSGLDSGGNFFAMSLIFFIFSGLLLWFNLDKIATINFYLVIPLFAFVIYLFFVCLPFIDFKNFSLEALDFSGIAFNSNWFLPYGIWLFALTGFSAIPAAKEIFLDSPLKNLKKVVLISSFLCAGFYWLFIFSIFGVSGLSTSEDAFTGILNIVGEKIVFLGSVIGFLAVFTSFLTLGVNLRDTFRLDFNLSRSVACCLTFVPPLILFLAGVDKLTKILDIVGSIGLGFVGALIVLMAWKQRKIGASPPVSLFRKSIEVFSVIAIVCGVVYELWRML